MAFTLRDVLAPATMSGVFARTAPVPTLDDVRRRVAALSMSPGGPDAMADLADALIDLTELMWPREAASAAERVLAQTPADAPGRCLVSASLARARSAVTELDAARAALDGQVPRTDLERLTLDRERARVLLQSGQAAAAAEQLSIVVPDAGTRLGSDDPFLPATSGLLGYCLAAAGRGAQARPLLDTAANAAARLLGPVHHRTVIIRTWSAWARMLGGDLAGSIEELTVLAAEVGRTTGQDHASYLAVANLLAISHRHARHLELAQRLSEEVLERGERLCEPDHPDLLVFRANVANGYAEAGRPAQAVPLLEQIVDARLRRVGPDHPSTLMAQSNLALQLGKLGRTSNAVALGDEVLTRRRATLGPGHPDTLTTAVNLAGHLALSGRPAETLDLLARTLAEAETSLGPEHPVALTARGLLGFYRCSEGDPAGLPLLRTNLDIRLRHPENPAAATTARGDLARALVTLGTHAEAIELLRENLAELQRQHPTDHPDVLRGREALASAYRSSGDHAFARDLLADLRPHVVSRYGAVSREVVHVTNLLAMATQSSGDLRGALHLFEENLAVAERVYGADHAQVLVLRGNLASTLQHAGDAAAVPLLRSVLASRTALSGADDLRSLLAANNLACALGEGGDLAEAVHLQRDVVEQAAARLPEGHVQLVRYRLNLAHFLLQTGDEEHGLPLLVRGLTEAEAHLGREHAVSQWGRSLLATAYRRLGHVETSRSLARQQLDEQLALLGPEHPAVLLARNNLAMWEAPDDPAGAVRLHEENLAAAEQVLSADHPLRAAIVSNLAVCLMRDGQRDRALQLLSGLLSEQEEELGTDHLMTIGSRRLLGIGLGLTGDRHWAVEALTEALAAAERRSGPAGRTACLVRGDLAQACADDGRFAEALDLERTTLTALRERLGEADPRTVRQQALVAFRRRVAEGDAARDELRDAADRAREVLGEDDPMTRALLELLGPDGPSGL